MQTEVGDGSFRPTMWSVVLRAADAEAPHRRTALNRLCETYWKPVYVYLRRKGLSTEDAKDATQGFFTHFLEKGAIERVEPARGRFKNYLLAYLEHYLANEHRKERAARRGGGACVGSLDFARAETEVRVDPAGDETPERVYRRSWALTVLQNAFEGLRREFESRGLTGHFDAVRAHLAASSDRAGYEQIARRLGTSVSEVTNLLHRSRRRLREIIREALRETVETEADVDEEVRELFESL
ncbi:MAG: sigma-70 family RNA polymerase sigma factor [Planctomycetes bacterium]|nr:sigma-70 family RNA polymerase sigma factor [Planctomycetota bacterium]